jgi:hypothetical protein
MHQLAWCSLLRATWPYCTDTQSIALSHAWPMSLSSMYRPVTWLA